MHQETLQQDSPQHTMTCKQCMQQKLCSTSPPHASLSDYVIRESVITNHNTVITYCHCNLQARGHRPYMEDRHTIITALNPSSAAAAAALAADDISAAAAVAAANGNNSSESAAAAVHDGVGRSYAAIFDGHNGAGAAETAGRYESLLAGFSQEHHGQKSPLLRQSAVLACDVSISLHICFLPHKCLINCSHREEIHLRTHRGGQRHMSKC